MPESPVGAPETRPPLSPGMGFAALSFGANLAVALVSAVATSRLYGIEVIGRYSLAMTPWLLLVAVSTVSEQIAMIRLLATMGRGTREATGVFLAVLSVSSCLTALMSVPVLLLSAAALRGPVEHGGVLGPAIAIVVGYVVFENPAWNLDSVLSAFSQGRRLFWCRLTTVSSFLILAVAFRSGTDRVWGLALATVASFAIGLGARLVATRDLLGARPRWADYRDGLRRLPEILRFGIRLIPGQVFIGLTLQAPVWIVAGSSSLAQVGAYSRASTMAVRLNEASYRVNEMLFPDLVRHHARGDAGAFAGALGRTLRLALAGLLLVAALGGGAAAGVMRVFGAGFGQAAGALAFLLLAHVSYVAASIVGSAFSASDRPQLNSGFSAVRLLAGVSLMAVVTPRYGITATAAAFFGAHLLELAGRVLWLRRRLGLRGAGVLDARTVLALGGSFLAAFAAARGITLVLGDGALGLVSALGIGLAAFAAAATATDLVEPAERRSVVRRARAVVRRPRATV